MWHLGCVIAACLSKKHKVTGCDFDSKTIEGLKNNKPPIFEPGMAEGLEEGARSGMLSYSTDVAASVKDADAAIVAFDTPVDENDQISLAPIHKAMSAMMPSLHSGQLLMVCSQVPVGTTRELLKTAQGAGKFVFACYSPENLRLGSAIETFLNPERIVIGLSEEGARKTADEIFEGVGGKRLYMDLESAEMAKHAMNAYLATMISFSGEISDLCERTGADASEVMGALKSEKRVSPSAPLSPGLGFGGGTLARDLKVLSEIGQKTGVPTRVVDAAYQSNRDRLHYVKNRLEKILGTLKGKKIAFFGLTYKPGTDTLRRSLALEVISEVSAEGAEIRAYDPAIKGKVEGRPEISLCASAEEAAQGSDAIVITTAWKEICEADYNLICRAMRRPVLFDARNCVDNRRLEKFIEHYGVGYGHGGK